MSSKVIVLIIIGVAVVGGGIFLLQSDSSPVEPIGSGEPVVSDEELAVFEDIVFEEYTQDTLAGYLGQPVVANSWATWCPFCVDELPDFAKVQEEFGDQVTIISIDRAESLKQSKGYTNDLGITDSLVFMLDPSDSFYREIGGFSMPETIFIDREGVVQFHKRGPMTAEEMREKIQLIL